MLMMRESSIDTSVPLLELFRIVAQYVGVALDLDDSLICSEIVAAGVSAHLVNPILVAAGKPELTIEHICRNYSGSSFPDQVKRLQEAHQITIPQEIIDQKEQRNLKELGIHARPLPGVEVFLGFLRDINIKASIFTASNRDRVEASITCAKLNNFITVDNAPDDHRIHVLSAKQACLWRGIEAPAMPSKPSPLGYQFIAESFGLSPEQMWGGEDSDKGLEALLNGGYGGASIISISRRCDLLPDHVEKLQMIVNDHPADISVVNRSWAPAARSILEIGLRGAHKAGVSGLPERLPDEALAWIDRHFPTVQRFSDAHQFKIA